MVLIIRICTILIFIFLGKESLCQEWIRIYGQGLNAVPRYVISDYDRGFNILGDINYKYSWIIKIDVNGYILHEKRIGNGYSTIWSSNIERTIDNGYILCGTWTKFNLSFDAFLIKLNSCYEIEWCKTIITPTNYDMGIRIKPTPEGDFILLGAYFSTSPVSNVSLFKFNSSGDLIWHQFYPMENIYNDDQPKDLLVDYDGYSILSSRYYPDPGTTSPAIIRSYFIKTDTAGNKIWDLVYGANDYYYSWPWALTKNQYSHYYATCTHTENSDNPAIIKVLHIGVQSYNHDIVNTGNFNFSGFSTIDLLNDTNIVLAGVWTLNSTLSNIIVKTDTLGDLKVSKQLPLITNTYISTAKAIDNKFLTIGNDATGGSWKIYAVKVNSDLEYDSLYTQPLVYDSLCPYPIVSDTVDPGCDNVYVGIEEPFKKPETTKLKVYPNPATDLITVEMPKYLVSRASGRVGEWASGQACGEERSDVAMDEWTSGQGVSAVTIFHQWKAVMLEVYDLSGKKVFEKEVIRAETEIGIDVSGWRKGMYIFRLIFNDREVCNEKVVVR